MSRLKEELFERKKQYHARSSIIDSTSKLLESETLAIKTGRQWRSGENKSLSSDNSKGNVQEKDIPQSFTKFCKLLLKDSATRMRYLFSPSRSEFFEFFLRLLFLPVIFEPGSVERNQAREKHTACASPLHPYEGSAICEISYLRSTNLLINDITRERRDCS